MRKMVWELLALEGPLNDWDTVSPTHGKLEVVQAVLRACSGIVVRVPVSRSPTIWAYDLAPGASLDHAKAVARAVWLERVRP